MDAVAAGRVQVLQDRPLGRGRQVRTRAAQGGDQTPEVIAGPDLVGGLIAFPITVLIAATAAAFGPAAGLAYATAGSLLSAIVTYAVGGKQYVATTSGNISRSTFKTAGSPTIIIMALGAKGAPASSELPAVKRVGSVLRVVGGEE